MTAAYWRKLSNQGVDLRERHELDFYPTDYWHVEAAFDQLPTPFVPQDILDPSMGYGVFGAAARHRYPKASIVGVDVNPCLPRFKWHNWNIQGDFLGMTWDEPMFDLIISNPPYGEAEAFVRRSLQLLRPNGWLVFLLRLSFAESVGRYLLLTQEAPPRYITTCSDRPSFTGDGKTDSSAYAYFVWQKGYTGFTTHRWVVADPAKAQKQVYQPTLI